MDNLINQFDDRYIDTISVDLVTIREFLLSELYFRVDRVFFNKRVLTFMIQNK